MAGIEMFLQGGNAMDAAIAVATALNVVEPFMSGIGGVGLMVVSSARTGERHVLDFIGRVPAAADPDRATLGDLDGGARACLTPGNCGGWLAALERFGTMPRATVLGPAIRLAEDGAPLSWKNVDFIDKARATLGRSLDAERIFLSGALRPGALLAQKDLAATYRQVAEGGAEAFYRGPIAQRMARAVGEAGGWLTEKDLAGFAAEWRTPLTVPFRGAEISTAPPPFSAFQYLETLNILEPFDLAGWGHNSADYLHHLIEAVKLASADRLAFAYADGVPIAGLASKAYAASQRQRIDPQRAGASEGERFDRATLANQILPGHPADFSREHTTHFACADASGLVVTVTQTLGAPFGSGFVANGTGVVLNNLLKWMDLDPESPNRLNPGRKAGTMMSPTQIFRDGRFAMSIGTPGSYGILQTTPQMILNALVFDMNVQEAIEAPRVRVYRDRLVDAESRIDPGVRAELARRGHEVQALDDWSWVVGGGQGITRDAESGALGGGADPRRDGYALAC
jgi:gamma-glutamyltranspeptidase/glutathione hydrolase